MNVEAAGADWARRRRKAGTHVFLLSCTALVGSFFAWATIGELDVVSTATGEVVPASKVKSVQHLEGGIVREILVSEGDRVRRGQPLVVLEPTTSGADVDELKVRLTSHRVRIAILKGSLAGAGEPKFPRDLVAGEPALVKQARGLFHARRKRIENQTQVQREQIVQRQQEMKEVRVRLRNNAIGLELVREQIGISKKLLKLNLTNRMTHLSLLREESSLKGGIEEDNAVLPRLEAAQNEARARLKAIETGFQEEAHEELEKVNRGFKEHSQRIRKFEDSLRRTVLRAPMDGTVKSLYVFTEGGVIRAGGTVLDIVPAGDLLIVEARLPPQDIGYVRTGQPVLVQLASGDAARFGNLAGEVTHVSPDTIVTQEGVPFYKVRIRTERAYFQRGELRYDLFPGMQVQCSIQTGTRTVLEYLVEPYVSSFKDAMRER